MTRNDNRILFRAPAGLFQWLAGRARRGGGGSVGLQARYELETWQAAQAAELARIPFTAAQLACLAGLLADVTPATSPGRLGTAYLEVLTELHDPQPGSRYDRRLLDDLLTPLSTAGPAADAALFNALDRWRHNGLPATTDGFTAVGFRCTG